MARDAVTQTAKSETAEESPIASDKYQPLASSSALEKSPTLEKSPASKAPASNTHPPANQRIQCTSARGWDSKIQKH
ncbi:MAG: hypothetical protein IPL73_30005 [Candidatus Obscuribacter sp.]|nr:hypothetical protein [Candidatus Obscuribacter sp.]